MAQTPTVESPNLVTLPTAPMTIAPLHAAPANLLPAAMALDATDGLSVFRGRYSPRSSAQRSGAWAVCVSLVLHVAAGIALAHAMSTIGPRIEISESGRNSIALVASMQVVAPPNPEEQLVVSAAPKSEKDLAKDAIANGIELIAKYAELMAGPQRIELEHVDTTAEKTTEVQQEISKDGDDRGEKTPTPSQSSPGAVASRGADLDRLPSAVHNPAPIYPPDALKNRWTGRVVVRTRVAADGRVLSAEIATSSGIRQLDDSALAAVRQWRFTPAQRGGMSIEWEIGVPVRFVVQNQ